MPPRKPAAPPDPDKLSREAAGSYRTADERFEVREADVGWFLVDTTQANEFGQELIHGPYRTLTAVREAIPGARREKVTPLRPRAAPKKEKGKGKAEPPPPPPSWIDLLPMGEGRAVRKLIAALERDRVAGAEELVRRDRDGLMPAVATQLIRQRLDELLEDAKPGERKLVQRAVEILTSDGTGLRDPLPGWVLVEIGPEDAPRNRRIDLGE
jgi:hypothetical protein